MTVVSAALLPAVGAAAPWALKPGVDPLSDGGRTAQKVELVDFDADGWVDIAFANSKGEGVSGGPATREINALLRNAGTDPVSFTEVQGVFEDADNAWVVKAGDVDNDGDADLVVGEVYDGSMSYVLLNEGGGVFTRHDIPLSANRSIGELELGDIDHDGNLDIVAADWGNLPHGQIDDPGAPLRLWLGNGDGSFSDGSAKLAMGADVLAAWSFDLELVDINNDFWLDVMVSTHGDADPAVVLLNDGKGNLVVHPVPALQPMNVKNINTAFTPMDFNGDGFVDVVSLQDGGITACMPDCARRNSILINDQKGQFEIPPNYWTGANNPGKRDFDAATLDFNNDGVPDLVTVGVQLAAFDQNGRLFVNDGSAFTPAPPLGDAFAAGVVQLAHTTGVMFADFDHDRREDMVLAQRDPDAANYVLIGKDDPNDGVPEDTRAPRIYEDANFGQKLPTLLKFGDRAELVARVNDYKTPTHWHDFWYDETLDSLNLVGDGAGLTAHKRRLPYVEFAFGLANPDDIKAMADTDPKKYIAPSIWIGESLWRVGFEVPFSGTIPDTLTWQYCAIDAAGNKACAGPYQITVEGTCGDGVKQDWEECDDGSPTCIECVQTCGNGTCEEHETPENCPQDCLCGNGVCDPGEEMDCPQDCPDTAEDSAGMCGDGICQMPQEDGTSCPQDCCDGICDPTGGEMCPMDCQCGNGICDPGEEQSCPEDCASATESTTGAGGSGGECPDTGGDQCELDDDGCGCVAETENTRGLWASLLLLGVFGIRRARKRA